jgi:DNA-binding transcriptional MerR regulator
VTSRTYLSIGDVLTLLREEFPDVTISKIRFLESQGLVNPERSPSGYRKFFDHDVERLRWVLRQQREHFLPLKVIRDRLADGELDDGELEDGDNGKQAATRALDGAKANHADEQPTQADEEAMARILADASRRAARIPEAAQAHRGQSSFGEAHSAVAHSGRPGVGQAPVEPAGAGRGAPPMARGAEASAVSGAAPAASTPSPPAKGSGRGNGVTEPGSSGPPSPSASTPARNPATSAPPPAARSGQTGGEDAAGTAPTDPAGTAPTDPAGTAPTGAAGAPPTGAAGAPPTGAAGAPPTGATPTGAAGTAPTTGMVTGASMTADELCAASGLSREELEGFEGFGLICPVKVAGMETYDEEALTVANLAAAFRGFGIEARHLRLFRNAADRELGLIEQVVIPLLRQRNPESRQRAVDSADQLAALGQSLRASLLRQALRQHFGG